MEHDPLDLIREFAMQLAAALRAAPPGLLTLEELAAALRVSPKTIRKMTREGLPVRRVATFPRYSFDEALEWLKARESKGEHVPSEEPAPRRISRRRAA